MTTARRERESVNGWSCDERQRRADTCRNPHGCHCREITTLRKRIADLEQDQGTEDRTRSRLADIWHV